MADYSRTRTALATSMAAIKTQLETYSTWNVAEYWFTTYDLLFRDLATLTWPACVLVHESSVGADEPHRTIKFTVLVGDRDMGGESDALDDVQGFVEKAIELLDFQLMNSNSLLIRYAGSKPFRLKNSGMIMYQVFFTAEDN